jgi:hypothetical protein
VLPSVALKEELEEATGQERQNDGTAKRQAGHSARGHPENPPGSCPEEILGAAKGRNEEI